MENANGVIKKLTSAERSYYTAAEVRERNARPLWLRKKIETDTLNAPSW